MLHYHLSFQSPWYLLLLAVIPPLWWLSFRKLSALGPVRRWLALALRSAVVGLLILALAEAQIVRVTERLTAIFLLDQSLSIPAEQREAMVHYVNAAVAKHRKKDDRVGVIVFRRDAAIEIPPFDYDVKLTKIEVAVDPEHTDLAAAMKLAQATFAEDAAKRIVVVSDGNENLGNAMEQAKDWRPPEWASTCYRSATAIWPRWRSSGWSSRPTSAAASPSTSAWSSTTSLCRGRTTPAWSTANWSSTSPRPREPGC